MSKITLGEKIRRIRKSLKLNQLEFAEKLGFKSATAISKFEDNSREPEKNKLIEIAKMGRITLDELLTDVDSPATYNKDTAPPPPSAGHDPHHPAAAHAQEFSIAEDLILAAKVLESRTHYATALHLNIRSFIGGVSAEATISKCQDDLRAQGELLAKLQTRVDDLDNQNSKLREEIKSLKGFSGGSPPIDLGMDHAAPTGTEDQKT